MAPLLYSQGIIYQISEPDKVFSSIENFSKLRETHGEDEFILTKYLLKLMVGYFPSKTNSLNYMFDQRELREIHKKAIILNE